MNVQSAIGAWRSWAFRTLGRRAWRRFEAAAQDPSRAQSALLTSLLQANATSGFGHEHGFANVGSWEDYRSAVPIADYERFRPYVDRIVAGETIALTADPPYMLTQTSGTTGTPKLIPVTRGQREAGSAATRVWFYQALSEHPRLFDGRILAMVSPAIEGYTEGGLPYGSASGHIYQNAPWGIRHLYALPYEVAEIKDYEARYYVAVRLALEQNVSFIGTPNPSTISRLMETAEAHADQLIKEIHDGTLSNDFDIPAEIRRALADRLAPNPRRGRALSGMAQAAGTLRPADYWPYLQLVGCWKGGSVGVQLEKLRRWFPPSVPFRDIGYLASEANMAIPIQDAGAGGVLAVDANVYEFIPEEAIEDPDHAVLCCDQIAEGASYYIVLTSPNGLYRYELNDIVRVTGFFHSTPIVEFVRKGRDMTSIGGEKLHVSQVVDAMAVAEREAQVAVRAYRAVASASRNRYEFLVELESDEPDTAAGSLLLSAMDRHLGELNIEYAQKRASQRLGTPCLCLMEPGWSQRSFQRRVEAGGRDTQLKPTLLTDHFEAGDEDQIRHTIELPPPSPPAG